MRNYLYPALKAAIVFSSVMILSGCNFFFQLFGTGGEIKIDPSHATISTNEVFQFKAYKIFEDGQREDVTSQVNWTSSNTDVIIFLSPGLIQPVNSGRCSISAQMGDKYDTKSVEVFFESPTPEPTPDPEGSTEPTPTPMPIPNPPDLHSDSDTGSSNIDNLTNKTDGLMFRGQADSKYTIELSENESVIDSTTIYNGYIWTTTITESLFGGLHYICVRWLFEGVPHSEYSQPLEINIDTVIPQKPGNPKLDEEDDIGVSNSDSYTPNSTDLTFQGDAQGGENIILVKSSIDGDFEGVQIEDGHWSFTTSLSEGNHSIIATLKDPAGNESLPSTLDMTVDKTPPGVSGLIVVGDRTPHSVSLSWSPGTDNLTSQEDLYYAVYYSLTESNVIDAITAEQNGTIGMEYSENTTSAVVADLEANKNYYFNVIIRDKGDKKASHYREIVQTLPSNAAEIDIKVDNVPFNINGTYNFNDVHGTPVTFTIKNCGDIPLLLTGDPVTLEGSDYSLFSVTQPAKNIAAGATSSFTVTFSPTTVGTKSAYFIINNNDSDESQFKINLQGNGI